MVTLVAASTRFTAGMLMRFRKFAELPSKTAKKPIKASLFSSEPVGWSIEKSSPDMLVFASVHPHLEGGPEPTNGLRRPWRIATQKTWINFTTATCVMPWDCRHKHFD
jgi:hypothetical protein